MPDSERTLTHAGAAQVRRPHVLDLKLSAGKRDFLQAQKRGWLHYQMRQCGRCQVAGRAGSGMDSQPSAPCFKVTPCPL